MNKTIKTIAVITILILFYVLNLSIAYKQNCYTKEATVVCNNFDNFIMVETNDGNLWEFEADSSLYTIGENVTVTFYNNTTLDIIEDDTIEKVEKI